MAEAEVMLEVEVLEVSRNKLAELGLRFPDQAGFGLLQGRLWPTAARLQAGRSLRGSPIYGGWAPSLGSRPTRCCSSICATATTPATCWPIPIG